MLVVSDPFFHLVVMMLIASFLRFAWYSYIYSCVILCNMFEDIEGQQVRVIYNFICYVYDGL